MQRGGGGRRRGSQREHLGAGNDTAGPRGALGSREAASPEGGSAVCHDWTQDGAMRTEREGRPRDGETPEQQRGLLCPLPPPGEETHAGLSFLNLFIDFLKFKVTKSYGLQTRLETTKNLVKYLKCDFSVNFEDSVV